ncbi:hypothetical protein ZIOFF_023320 [Zingiber officinale]|uniref:Retrovirus-related Pol polyprotein from transposon TNT 1-94-like beta-barrel domain-containing protein n=1 Tax=Zingiber officinale TaxID=94328 RepID=A0A8J5L9U9_ZINOF|nr:hypothetical protein ZIOFF_023320 [Zingiber officinale]
MGNRMKARIEGIGTYRLILDTGCSLDLENCLYVPICARNLISVGKLDDPVRHFFPGADLPVWKIGVVVLIHKVCPSSRRFGNSSRPSLYLESSPPPLDLERNTGEIGRWPSSSSPCSSDLLPPATRDAGDLAHLMRESLRERSFSSAPATLERRWIQGLLIRPIVQVVCLSDLCKQQATSGSRLFPYPVFACLLVVDYISCSDIGSRSIVTIVLRQAWVHNMDLETENRLASLLLEEARRLCAEAEKGVHVYLHMPSVRCQLNSRFLTAAVLGVHTTRLEFTTYPFQFKAQGEHGKSLVSAKQIRSRRFFK